MIFFYPPDLILSHWNLNYLLEPLMRNKFSAFVNEDEFYLTFIKHTLLCLVCSLEIFVTFLLVLQDVLCVHYCNIQSKAFKWCFLPFFVYQCMYNDQKPSKSYAKPSNELHVRNKVHPASCYRQHEIHVNMTPFFLNRQSHSLVTQSYVLIRS
jgi:hypothetical protein